MFVRIMPALSPVQHQRPSVIGWLGRGDVATTLELMSLLLPNVTADLAELVPKFALVRIDSCDALTRSPKRHDYDSLDASMQARSVATLQHHRSLSIAAAASPYRTTPLP